MFHIFCHLLINENCVETGPYHTLDLPWIYVFRCITREILASVCSDDFTPGIIFEVHEGEKTESCCFSSSLLSLTGSMVVSNCCRACCPRAFRETCVCVCVKKERESNEERERETDQRCTSTVLNRPDKVPQLVLTFPYTHLFFQTLHKGLHLFANCLQTCLLQ